MSLEYSIFRTYANGMEQINNEEMLQNFTINSYTKMGAEDRKSLHKKTFKHAFPNEFSNPKNIVKLSDLSKVLRNG
jgi:hypothetical protein